MSWSFSTQGTREEIGAKLSEAESAAFEHWAEDQYAKVEMKEQAARAVTLAMELMSVVGTDGEIRIVLSGHGNTDHGKDPGWANESVTIVVGEV